MCKLAHISSRSGFGDCVENFVGFLTAVIAGRPALWFDVQIRLLRYRISMTILDIVGGSQEAGVG